MQGDGHQARRLPAEGSMSIEASLYVCALVLGVVLRLLLLDARPLSVDEGAVALQSYRIMLGQFGDTLRDGPLPTYAVSATLALFGGGDGAARVSAAVEGGALILAPWLLRATIGRTPGVLAAWGFAVSPLLLLASRTVGSDVLVGVIALTLWRTCEDAHAVGKWRPLVIAVLVAALIGCGPSGLTAGLALGLAALLSHPDISALLEEARSAWRSHAGTRIVAILFAAVLVISTGFGANLKGVQYALVDVWSSWVASMALGGARGGALVTLALYELPVLLFALGGLGITLARRRRTDMLLSLWAMILLLMGMAQPVTGISRVTLPLVPIYLLASRAVAWSLPFARGASSEWRWRVSMGAVAVPVFVGFGLLNRSSLLSEPTPVEFMYGQLGLVLGAVLVLAILADSEGRKAVAWYSMAAVSLMFLVHSSVFLNYRVDSSSSEPIIGQQISPQLRHAAVEAAYYSTYFDATVRVDPQLRLPLAWYLRSARNVEYSTQPADGISFALAAANQGALSEDSARIPGVYTPAIEGGGLSWRGAWGWMMARSGLVTPNPRDIILRAPASAL